jgi:hypothetical protein
MVKDQTLLAARVRAALLDASSVRVALMLRSLVVVSLSSFVVPCSCSRDRTHSRAQAWGEVDVHTGKMPATDAV